MWEPEPRALPERVAEDDEPVLSRRLSRVGALSSCHKSSSNRISLGMGRRSSGGGRADRGCLSEPAPPAALRVAPELLWRRPAHRAVAAPRRPDLRSREAEGSRRPPSAANSGGVGDSQENLGDAAGAFVESEGCERESPRDFEITSDPPFRTHPISVYICSRYSLSTYSRL